MTPKKSWATKLKEWRKDKAEAYARTMMSPPAKTTLLKAMPYPGVCLIMGHRGYGKTGLAHEIASQEHSRRGVSACLHLPGVPEDMRKKTQRLVPRWIKVTTHSSQWPTKAVVIYDEASQSAHARRTQSGDAVLLDNIIGVSRQRNQLILFISHHSRKLDPNVVHEVDRILWKMPTHAHALFERDELSDFTYKALDFFAKIRGDTAKKKATLVMDFQNLEFSTFTNKLPPWWNDKLSRIFQDIEVMAKKK